MTNNRAARGLELAVLLLAACGAPPPGERPSARPTASSGSSSLPAPSNLSPPNGANVVVPFTASWSAVSDPAGIVAYNWQVSPSSSMSPVIMLNSTSGQTQDRIGGLANGTWFWQVQAVNGSFVQGQWSKAQSFNVTGAGPSEPGTPTLNPPKAGSTFHPMEVVHWSWSSAPGAVTYQWDAATDPNFPVVSQVHFDNIPPDQNADYGVRFGDSLQGNFYARVRAVTADGLLGVPSNSVPFTISFNAPLPPPPTPIAPANGSTTELPVTFRWTDVPNPQPSGYEIQVAKDPGFSNLEFFYNQITPSTYVITSLTSGTKYWHVRSMQGDASPTSGAVTAWSATQSFTIPSTPPAASSIAVANTSPGAGYQEAVWIQLTTPAPSGGAVVNLASSNPAAAPIPATFTMPAGFGWGQLFFDIGSVTRPTPVTLTASINGTSASTQLTVQPPTLQWISLGTTNATGGVMPIGAILMLNGNAPADGLVVNVSSNSPAASPPSTVTIPAGSPSLSFNIPTSAVAADTPVTITATLNGTSVSSTIALTPQIAPASVSLSPATTGSATCCSDGTVTMAAPASTDTYFSLASSDTSVATVNNAAMIPAGVTAGGFFIQTYVVAAPRTVTISVTGAGVTQTATLTVVPSGACTPTTCAAQGKNCGSISDGCGGTLSCGACVSPQTCGGSGTPNLCGGGDASISLSSLALSPTTLRGGNRATGTVTLSAAAPAAGAAVSLSSNNPSIATVPSSVTVVAGAITASFPIRTQRPRSDTTVTITAVSGGSTKEASLTVRR